LKIEEFFLIKMMLNNELKDFLIRLLDQNSLNRLPEIFGGGKIFSNPLMGIADGADPIFQQYKTIINESHLTPMEMWEANGLNLKEADSSLKVISIVFPYTALIREKSMHQTTMPADIYCIGRNYANELIFDILKKTKGFLEKKGFSAMIGILNEKYNILVKRKYPYFYSTWSERHVAFAAGLGTFSLHEGLITELGCNIRLGSVITDAPLKATPRKNDDPYGNCLFYTKGTCKKCVERCPAGALSEKGHDKWKCFKYEQMIASKMEKKFRDILKPHWRRIAGVYKKQRYPPVGCAFCQFNVPCMDKNPIHSKN